MVKQKNRIYGDLLMSDRVAGGEGHQTAGKNSCKWKLRLVNGDSLSQA